MDEQKGKEVTAEELKALRKGIKAAWVQVEHAALGGTDCAVIRVSLDKKEDWAFGIFHNSRGSIFMWNRKNDNLEQLTLWKVAKFRKRKVKDVGTVIAKINECLEQEV